MEPSRSKKSANNFRFGRVIGEGSFSTVYLAKEIDTNREYAIKVCNKNHIIREKKQDYVKRERQALHLLNNSQNIVTLLYTFQDASQLFFVMSYARNGELLQYINKLGSLSLECAQFYSAELLIAIEEMHRKKIIHRDLKPENLLLDRNMHLMVADFGSSKILPDDYDYAQMQADIERCRIDDAEGSDDNDDDEAPSRRRRRPSGPQKRRQSFVGTAQYVSPEILKGNAAHLATDLWSYGCIIYQMISGLPPFRGPTDYLIFQKVLNVDYEFPEGFDENAQDLIQKLLHFNPRERLGASDTHDEHYYSIRKHPFFKGINWKELFSITPPSMTTGTVTDNASDSDNLSQNDFHISDEIEPGLGQRQLRRLLQQEFGTAEINQSPSNLERLLEEQRSNPWVSFVDENELILKYGFVNKRVGLFSRRRMLLLTATPRLIYIDPSTNIKKGEIPFDETIQCEPKNFKVFLVHTPNRTYYLEDPQGNGLKWCDAIKAAKEKYLLGINN